MRTVSLQSGVAYGPVDSRRFGKSLGINLLPDNFKVCSFDCVYCQYTDGAGKPKFRDFAEIYTQLLSDFEEIRNRKTGIDWIMLAGNGEPTLYPGFSEVVEGLLTLRQLYFPKASIGVLSNSSTCHRKEIREALSKLDGRFMKLDAGNLDLFHALNRPASAHSWGDVIDGLCKLPGTTLQSMFVKGLVDNTGEKAVEDWIETVRRIRPLEVQIYSVDRTPKEEGVLPAAGGKLQEIADKLKMKTAIPAKVYF